MAKAQQKRAIATREKILDAIEEMLEDQEFEAISIADLASRAGVAVGSVYSHFKDKDALLPALLDRQVKRGEARLREIREQGTMDGVPVVTQGHLPSLRDTIEKAIIGALKQITENLGVRRALLTYRRLNPDLDLPEANRMRDNAFAALVGQLEHYRDEIRHEDITEAAKMVVYFVNILFLDRVVYVKSPFETYMRPSDEELIENYTNMVFHYLTGK